MIYGSCHLEKVTWPLLGVPNWYSWSMGYRSAMNILCPDSESPQKNKSRYKSNHPKQRWSYFPIFTDLAILGATVRISNFPVHIQNLLKKQVQIQVRSSQTGLVIFPDFHRSSHIRCYSGNFKFPCSYSESPQKTSPDTSQTIPNGGGHISWFSQI